VHPSTGKASHIGLLLTLSPVSAQIHPYRSSDWDFLQMCLSDLRDQDVREDPWGLNTRNPGRDREYSSAMLQRYRENHGFMLVAEQDGNPAGFVAAWVEKTSGQGTYSRLVRLVQGPIRRGHVSEIVVLGRFRRTGIGSRLLRAAEERLQNRDCDIIELDVGYSNSGARRFYGKSGYAPRSLSLAKRTMRGLSGRNRARHTPASHLPSKRR